MKAMARVFVAVTETRFTDYPPGDSRKTLQLRHIHVGYLYRKPYVIMSAHVTGMTGYNVRSVTNPMREIFYTILQTFCETNGVRK
jgi:hypothetical protein